MIDYTQILSINYAGSKWTLNGDEYDGLTWLSDTPKPTQAELDAQWEFIQESITANAYKAKRAAEYPSITDFADAYYWMQKGKTELMDAYVAKCEEIKLKYPK